MGGRAFNYEAVLFIATAQWTCNGSVPQHPTQTSRPLQGLPIGKARFYENSNAPLHSGAKPSNIVYDGVQYGNSDNAGNERLQRFVAHLVGVATGISCRSAEVDCALNCGAWMFGAADQPRLAGLVGDNEAEGNRGCWQHIGATETQGGGVRRTTRLLLGDALTLRLTEERHRGYVGEDGHRHPADAVQVNAAR